MKKVLAVFCVFVLCSFAQAVTMDWVTVGNAGNADDSSGFGAVSDTYQIGTYEVTCGQYTEFLNAVAATDTYNLYNTIMADVGNGGITRTGTSGSYTYTVDTNAANRPISYVSWYDTLRFANWMHNGQPTGAQTASTTEDGAYTFTDETTVSSRNAGAQVFLPTEDEWYKAAFHKNDGVTGNYYLYATSSDTAPSNDLVEPTDPGNNVTYRAWNADLEIYDYTIGDPSTGAPYYHTEVGAHENSDSPYGTLDQNGNVREWTEMVVDTTKRSLRGAQYNTSSLSHLQSTSDIYSSTATAENRAFGFRVAAVPYLANSPIPTYGDTSVSIDTDLHWNQGYGATSHDVYFGTDQSAVENARRLAGDINGDGSVDIDDLVILISQWLTDPGAVIPSADISYNQFIDMEDLALVAETWNQMSGLVFQGNQTGTTFDPGILSYNTTYYWRIDEVTDYGITTGTVWSFTTALAVMMDWVTIGNAGNADDSSGFGAVSDTYQIGTYEVTCGQYTEFLNAVAATDTYNLYNTIMADVGNGGITRTGTSGSYTYTVDTNAANRPISYVSWYDTLRFANWMHNGQPTGAQTASTTEDGAYTFTDETTVSSRNAGAQVFLPTEDEWYKAAFHKNDGVTGNYYLYATSSDTAPSNDLVDPTDPGNNVTYKAWNADLEIYDYTIGDPSTGAPYYHTEVGAHENSDSPYGTLDQNGNVREWTEMVVDTTKRSLRGAQYNTTSLTHLRSTSDIYSSTATAENRAFGFRVAAVSSDPAATGPIPVNGDTGVLVDTNLHWTQGYGATSRDVYFGTSSPGTFQGNQAATTFDPGTLAGNTTYYWRIDEINAYGTITGTVWSFTTESDTETVGKWQRYVVTLNNGTYSGNPFELEVDATFTHTDSGTQLTLPGYYDGNNKWKIGFMPTKTGEWTYVTSSSDSDLNGVAGAVNCVASGLPGMLKADATNDKKWKYADGPYAVPIFLRGKFLQEAADTTAITNMANFMATNNLTGWNFSCTDESSYGGRSDWLFSGSWTSHQFDLSIWQRLNERLDVLAAQGIGVHIFLYDDDAGEPGWNGQSSTERLVIRWLVARTCGYPVVFYNSGIDISEYRSSSDINWMGQRYAEFDPYDHPRASRYDQPNTSYSMTNRTFDSWWAPQQAKVNDMITHWGQISLPGANDDAYGENRSSHPAKNHSPSDIRRAFWKSLIAGGQGGQIRCGLDSLGISGYFSLNGVASDLESEQWLKHIYTFLEDYLGDDFGQMVPVASLADNAKKQYAIADPSRTKILYWKTSSADTYDGYSYSNMVVKLSGVSSSITYDAVWFDPRTGAETSAGSVTGGSNYSLTPPSSTTDDWVLLLYKEYEFGDPISTFGVSSDGRRYLINDKPVFLAGFREGYVGGGWNEVCWNQSQLPSDHVISPSASQVNYNSYAAAVIGSGMNMVKCTLIHMAAGNGRVHLNNQRSDAYNYPPSAPYTERPWARTGGGLSWDGLQKYNLNEWNTWYWQRLSDWVQTANENGIVVEVILFHQHNHYQIFTHYADNPLRPYNCNLATGLPNGYNQTAYPEYYGSNATLRTAQEAYVDKVLDTIGSYPGVIYNVADEYNWTDTWVEDFAQQIKDWGNAHGKEMVVQASSTMQQMKLMNSNIDVADGTFIYRNSSMSTCDPASLVEQRLAGYCDKDPGGWSNDVPTTHSTLLWMWNQLPGKALIRDCQSSTPDRRIWYSALVGGAAGYFYHGAFESGFSGTAATGTTVLAELLDTFDQMVPHDDLVTNAYALANPGVEYAVFLPYGGSCQVNLSAASGTMNYYWYSPTSYSIYSSGTVSGGATRSFSAPNSNDWVLIIK